MTIDDDKADFHSFPGYATLLCTPNSVWEIPGIRQRKDSGEDSLLSTTLKTSDTIRSCLIFYATPPPEPVPESTALIPEINILVHLGNGLNGFPSVLHGGIVATLLDESMGMLQTTNGQLQKQRYGQTTSGKTGNGPGFFTAELKIRYRRPVATPGVVWLTARFTKRETRKEWVVAELKQFVTSSAQSEKGEDGEWVVCSSAEGFWVQPRATNKL